MERQVSVGPERPVKEDHLWRWTTFSGKLPPRAKRSIYVSIEISGSFGIMKSTLRFELSSRSSVFAFVAPLHTPSFAIFHRILVDGTPIGKEKVALSNENGYVWTGPKRRARRRYKVCCC